MPTSHTLLTMYNLALDTIGEFPLATENDPNTYGRFIRRNFAPCVESTLRANPWNFACEYHRLSPEPEHDPFRWRYRFGLPPGWLRVLPLTHDGRRGGRPISHEVKRNYLYTNQNTAPYVECVMNVQDPGEWDPLFAEVIAGRLGVLLAHRFTGKASYLDRAKQIVDEAMATAEEINAFEGSIEPVEEHDIIRARGDWGSFNRGYDR